MPKVLKRTALLTYKAGETVADPINRRILAELQQRPRLSMTELGRRVGLTSPAAAERVRRLEERGVIRSYALDVDPAALGLPISAFIRVKPNAGQLPQLIEVARGIPEVVECHRVTGEDCLIIRVHLPDLEQLDRVLDAFLIYGSTTTSLVQSSPVPRRGLPLPP